MVFWIKKIAWGKVLLVSVIFTVISFVIHEIEAILTMRFYFMPQYFGVWSKLMMPVAGPPPMSYYIASIIFTFVSGISLSLIYYYVRDLLPPIGWKRITYFADLMIATSFVFFTLPVYLMFNVPVGLLVSWFISSFIILAIGSWVIVKILK